MPIRTGIETVKANQGRGRPLVVGPQSPDTTCRGVFAGVLVLLAAGIAARTGRAAPKPVSPIVQPQSPGDEAFIERAFDMRRLAVEQGDQAYGAVVVRDARIIGQSWSRVILDQDPSGHAEMSAIRDAALRKHSRDLSGAVLYSSSRPCPMCEAAAYWAGIENMVYGRDIRQIGTPRLCGRDEA